MVGGFQPMEAYRGRQGIFSHSVPFAQGVTLSLNDQGRRPEFGQMSRSRPVRPACRVKRVTQTDESPGFQLIRQQACHTPAHRLAADRQGPGYLPAQPRVHFTPTIQQARLRIGRTPATARPPLRHVGKLETHYGNPANGETLGHARHESAIHRSAGAMGQNQAGMRLGGRRTTPQPPPHPISVLRALIYVNTDTLPIHHPFPALTTPNFLVKPEHDT